MIRALALLLALLAAILGGQGLWIPAKAVLAQHLLADAWRRTAAGEEAARPWPWADTWPIARLEVPRLDVERIVLAGASGATLAFGPGWMEASARPGEPGNAILAGHRDTSFRFLGDLRRGDRLVLERPDGARVTYRIAETRVVDAADPWSFAPTDAPVLTLATCWPLDAPTPGTRLRYVVRARAVEGPEGGRDPEEAKGVQRRLSEQIVEARTRRLLTTDFRYRSTAPFASRDSGSRADRIAR